MKTNLTTWSIIIILFLLGGLELCKATDCLNGTYFVTGSGCTGSCETGCDICTSADACTSYTTYPGYTLYLDVDSKFNDLAHYTDGNFTKILQACNGVSNCYGFNIEGYLKKVIRPQSEWVTISGYKFYVKDGSHTDVDGYTFYQSKDSYGNDGIQFENKSLTAMKSFCDGNPYCAGFNSLGYTKKLVSSSSQWTTTSPSSQDYGLYVKDAPQGLDGYTFYQGKDYGVDNLTQVESRSLTEMKTLCDSNPYCFGMSTLGYLKKTLGSQSEWTTMANSAVDYGLYTKNNYTELTGYVFYQGKDSITEANLTYVSSRNATEMKTLCDNDPTCFGFNTLGYVKTALGPQSDWTTLSNTAPNYGLYVKAPQCPNKTYWVPDSGCTGQCSIGCQVCTNRSVCQVCSDSTSLYTDGYCRCNDNGFYYVESQQGCTGEGDGAKAMSMSGIKIRTSSILVHTILIRS